MDYRIKHPTMDLFWSDSEQTWTTQDKSSVYNEWQPPTRNLCLGENVYFMDEGQQGCLLRNLEEQMVKDGMDISVIAGLQIDSVQYNSIQKENRVYYSYEVDKFDKKLGRNKCELRRGRMEFTARFHSNKLEDVVIVDY